MKEIPDDLKPKAHLVARGFENCHTKGEKKSPTCSKDTIRTALVITDQNEWYASK